MTIMTIAVSESKKTRLSYKMLFIKIYKDTCFEIFAMSTLKLKKIYKRHIFEKVITAIIKVIKFPIKIINCRVYLMAF